MFLLFRLGAFATFLVDRKEGTRWGPRAMDVDILMYDELVLDGKSVEVYSDKRVCC